MSFKPERLEVSKEDPFAQDALDRNKKAAELLTNFVSSLTQPYVLAVDGAWGTGKTTFVRMWKAHLENEGFPALYFNAWKSDYQSEPFVALVGEMTTGIEKLSGTEEPVKTKLKKVKEAAKPMARRALVAGAKIATTGILNLDDFTEKTLANWVAESIEDPLEGYQKSKDALETFRTSLEGLVTALQERSEIDENRPLVFFIDELDRHWPTLDVYLTVESIEHPERYPLTARD